MGEWVYRCTFRDLRTRWRLVISFTPLPLYPQGKSLRYPLYRKLGGPQSQSGRYGEENNLTLPGIEPCVTKPTELSRLLPNYSVSLCIKRPLLSFISYVLSICRRGVNDEPGGTQGGYTCLSCLTRSTTPWRRMKSAGMAPPFLTSALDGGEVFSRRTQLHRNSYFISSGACRTGSIRKVSLH
jgi:hypothetical protein